ncbi:glycosyltransferase [Limosilactobacillus fermentum]
MLKIAVLVSYYDGDKFIREQLDSILSQRVDPDLRIDVYVRNDGSPNSDLAILKEYVDKGQISLLDEENVGVKLSFFKLLQVVDGYDYYFFSDQDDVWVDNKVQLMVNEMRKYPSSIPVGVYCDLFVADKDAKPTGKVMKSGVLPVKPHDPASSSDYILRYYEVTGAGFAINRAAREMAVSMGEDVFKKTTMHDAALGFMLTSAGTLVFMDTPLTYYRQHGNNLIGVNNHHDSIIRNIKSAQTIVEGRIEKIYGLFMVNQSINVVNNKERAELVKKVMIESPWKAPVYLWKLRDYVYGKHKVLKQIIYTVFGVSMVKKYQTMYRAGK